MTSRDIARKIVDDIFYDLTDRRGLRQEWEQIDKNIQKEILVKWIDIAEGWVKKLDNSPTFSAK